ESDTNGTEFLWTIEDTYDSSNFFDQFTFFDQGDPTHFLNQTAAFANGLAYVASDNTIVMKGDNTTWLASGAIRDSVRVQSIKAYNTSLIILDLNSAPWGCGVWPAFWVRSEIDILEGVHDNEHNQITWHTSPGCNLTPSSNYTGTLSGNLDCDTAVDDNSGCAIIDWSRASYGNYFNSQGGGVYAMKWDDQGISVWSFYRSAVPVDITSGGSPDPSGWGLPAAQLSPTGCDPLKFFMNQSIIFDITFCGDWAGNSYATTTCPGTCANQIMDPANFVNASWSINSLKVYSKHVITGTTNGARHSLDGALGPTHFALAMLCIVAFALTV
ncbi:glycoside hydrolase family 16 protein, partial [Athelia psychrophila]